LHKKWFKSKYSIITPLPSNSNKMKKKIITVIILTIIIFLIIRFGFDNKEINKADTKIDQNEDYYSETENINIPLRNDTVEINLQNIEAK
jgi:peptidoglycan hydrolase CwlO-like protein